MNETIMSIYETNTAPNALDFLGNYLKKEDVLKPQVVRITDVYEDDLPGESRKKLVARFAEFAKPMVLNSTNIKRLYTIFGTPDTATWRGEVMLYVDQNIEFGGKIVGGLRLRPAQGNGPTVAQQEPDRTGYQVEDEEFI
jgi:hypothetical protein